MDWLAPFDYQYMVSAILVSGLVGGVCGFLSAYLMLKGWSLMGDALSHSIVPGVAGAYMLGLPFALGAFLSGGLAASPMLFLSRRSKLKEDAIIGLIFSSFFGLGLFMVSISPVSVDVTTIVLGNILSFSPADSLQLLIISTVSLAILVWRWKDILVVFFDETHARTVGINTTDGNITFDANSNVVVTGIITATKFVGTIEPTNLTVGGDLTIPDKMRRVIISVYNNPQFRIEDREGDSEDRTQAEAMNRTRDGDRRHWWNGGIDE